MAIYHDGKLISGRYHGSLSLGKKYYGDRLVWYKYENEVRLPKAYQEVEYLQADGRQYINLNLLPSIEHSFTTKVKITDKNIANNMIIGSRTSGTFQTSDDQIYMNWQKVDKRIVLRNRYMANIIYFNEGVDGFFDLRNVQNENCQLTTVTQPYFLFALNKLGTPDALASCQMYNFIIRNNDGVVVNLVPCYRKSDNKSGMYDTITNTFFTSETQTDFSVGADVKCKKLEYCENINGNYIDTHIFGKYGIKGELDFEAIATTALGTITPFGYLNRESDTRVNSLTINLSTNNTGRFTRYGSGQYNSKGNFTIGKRYNVAIDENGLIVNEKLYKYESKPNTFVTKGTMWLFAGNGFDEDYSDGKYKVYSCKISESDTLKLDLIPYQIGDTVGMLDTISKVFFSGELVGKPFTTKQSRMR